MDRKEKVLRHIRKDGCGIEIGPSYNPIASKKEGYRVQTIDHMSRLELIDKYKDAQVSCDAIEEVDFIWRGKIFPTLRGSINISIGSLHLMLLNIHLIL